MAYREGDRCQAACLPPAIEEYVGPRDPVRAYDAIIESMANDKLGLVMNRNQVGNPAYNPKAMLKLLVYGYSYGWHSSRKLERACHHNLSFIWLMGGLKPDHKTIANLIEGNCLFTDSSKIRGAASIAETRTRQGWQQKLAEVDRGIEELLVKCDEIDAKETGSLVEVAEEIEDQVKLQYKIKSLLAQMEEEDLPKINGTDRDCVNFKGRQGSHAGYSAHITVDEKNGLIVSADVISEAVDTHQFTNQIAQAVDTLDKPCKTAVADAGYSNVADIKQTVDKGIDVIVPTQRQALHTVQDNPFSKDKFQYDAEKNAYICPAGKRLRYSHYSKKKGHYLYRMESASICQQCVHWWTCTISRRGRAIIRLKEEVLREELEKRYATDEGQAIYRKRKSKVELPFGHIKRNLNFSAFLLKGRAGVKAEWAILASCFNITRMINLTGGVESFVNGMSMVRN
jgi:hypothetical protein